MYKKALIFATKKHFGQKRRNGSPYLIHLIRVSSEVSDAKQKVIALLHDVIEDTSCSYIEIEQEFGYEIMCAVACLTHQKGEPYPNYIQRVKQNPDAIAVKIADISDNMADDPSEKSVKKSADALEVLLS